MMVERNRARYERREAYNRFVERVRLGPLRLLLDRPSTMYAGPGFDPLTDEHFEHSCGRHMDMFLLDMTPD